MIATCLKKDSNFENKKENFKKLELNIKEVMSSIWTKYSDKRRFLPIIEIRLQLLIIEYFIMGYLIYLNYK